MTQNSSKNSTALAASPTIGEVVLQVMMDVTKEQALSAEEIGRKTGFSSSRVTRRLTDLVRGGDLQREVRTNKNQKQCYFYWPTPQGVKKAKDSAARQGVAVQPENKPKKNASKKLKPNKPKATSRPNAKPKRSSEAAPVTVQEAPELSQPEVQVETSGGIGPEAMEQLNALMFEVHQLIASQGMLNLNSKKIAREISKARERIKGAKARLDHKKAELEELMVAEKKAQASIDDISAHIEKVKNSLAGIRATPAHASERLAYIKRLRDRPAFEHVAILKDIQDDYEYALNKARYR